MATPLRRRTPAGGRAGAEEDDGRRAKCGRQVGNACVVRDDATGARHQASELHKARPARKDRLGREATRVRDCGRECLLVRATRQKHTTAGGRLGSGDRSEALGRPAPGRALRSGMDNRGAGGEGGYWEPPGVEIEAAWVCGDPTFGEQPAPAVNLVFLLLPRRQARALWDRWVRERYEPARPRREEHAMACRTTAMEIDCDVRAMEGVVERSVWTGRNDVVDRVSQAGKRPEDGRGGEDEAMIRKAVPKGSKGRNSSE
jgi:hypothetical protein